MRKGRIYKPWSGFALYSRFRAERKAALGLAGGWTRAGPGPACHEPRAGAVGAGVGTAAEAGSAGFGGRLGTEGQSREM